MAKLVCHGEKYTKGAVAKIERHNERLNEHYSNQDIDLEKSSLNYKLMECKEKNYFAAVMKLVDTRNNPTGKNLRKDAIVLTEFIISSSNDFFDQLPVEKQKEYFTTALQYLEELFGKKNTVYAVIHNDEHTPHMHFGFVPMTKDNRVCAKEVINRNVLRKIQEELPKRLQQAGFDIERGEVDSNAVHRSVKQYKADMEKEKAALAITIQSEKKELQQIANKKSEINSLNQIVTGKTVFGGKVTLDESDYNKITNLAKKQIASEQREKSLKEENQALRKENVELSTQLHNLKSVKKRITQGQSEVEIRNLKQFQERAIEFMKRNGIYDFFNRESIHSNKKEL